MRAPITLASTILSYCVLSTCTPSLGDTDNRPPPFNPAVDDGTQGYYPIYTFATESDIIAPKTNWLQWDPQCNDGTYYFITPRGWGIETPGPMLLDWKGDLVWTKHFANEYGGQAYDFKLQEYQGQEHLTFWTGDDRVRGHGSGSYIMLNSSYDIVHEINAVNGLTADLHEFLITPDGTALLTIYHKTNHDLSSYRTFNATENPFDNRPNYIWDGIFQEISIEHNTLIFEWRASDHIPLNTTYRPIGAAGNYDDPWDFFHINSIQKDTLGNYLISARYTHSIYYIDGVSGAILWTLGGQGNDFMDLSDGYAINFAWQHDARIVSSDAFPSFYSPPPKRAGYTTTLISLFDNAAEDLHYDFGTPYSRGLLLEVTYPDRDDRDSPVPRSDSYLSPRSSDFPPLSALDQEKIAATNGSNPLYTVRLLQSYLNPSSSPLISSSQGSMQILPPTKNPASNNSDSRILLSYGLNAVFTEFSATGSVLCDAHFGAVTSWERGDIQSYRVYKFAWEGRPREGPRLVGRGEGEGEEEEVRVSWNGATGVGGWVLQRSEKGDGGEGDGDGEWKDLLRKGREGFETSFELEVGEGRERWRYLRALAIDIDGKVLENGISNTLDRRLLASSSPTITTTLPEKVAGTSGWTLCSWVLGLAIIGLALFEAYRKWLLYKSGSPAVGAVRWRKGHAYRSLGEV